jgi:MgtC family
MLVDRFPPAEVAARIALSLGIGLLVGIEREWSNKDLGIRTFALTALLGTTSLFALSMAAVSLVGVFLIVIFANARSLLVDRSLEATTSAALLVIFVLGALAGGACCGSDSDDDAILVHCPDIDQSEGKFLEHLYET